MENKFLYVILTCEKYLLSRGSIIKETWVNNLDTSDDYVFLSSTEDVSLKKVGYNTSDDYDSATDKYSEFISNFNVSNYDWVFFLDDDTFCFPKRVKEYFLNNTFDTNNNICICANCGNCSSYNFNLPCGGAGFIVSKESFNLLKEYLKEKGKENIPRYSNGDVSFGKWLSDINTIFIHSDLFASQHPDSNYYTESDKNNNFTFHYCNENHFNTLYRI
jgi:hypothetical protein